MPGYDPSQTKLLRYNEQKMLLDNETINVVPEASIAVEINRTTGTYYPWGISFEIWFSANPGNCEIDIQTADFDKDSHYCTISSITQADLNTNFVGRIELPQFWAKFVRAYVKTLTNSVGVSVMATR